MEQPSPLSINQIGSNLWIGNLQSLGEIRKLPNSPWTVISVVQSEKILTFARLKVASLGDSLVAEHHVWQLSDDSQAKFLTDRLQEILLVMEQAIPHRPCLVHCAMGISRSAAVCAAWLLHSRASLTLAGALERVRRVRPSVQPNMGLIASLRAIEQCDGNVAAAIERHKSKKK